MSEAQFRPYETDPCYAPATGRVRTGYPAAVASVPSGSVVLAVDGPTAVRWDVVAAALSDALSAAGRSVKFLDVREHYASWELILQRTASPELPDDPHFATLSDVELPALLDDLPRPEVVPGGVVVVYGPGAALVDPDVLWYADLPKRYAEAAITGGDGRNLGQPTGTGPGTTRRLFYIDWPVLDRHRDAIADRVALWLDTQDVDAPASLDGDALRATLAELAARPFRTRPTFNTTSWGGHWGQDALGFNTQAANTALGYELIAPESGILVGDAETAKVEVPFQLLVALHPEAVLGVDVHRAFGTSFPIRFDYLDTVGGGNLSVHCHPQSDYMRRVFGWPYTQHETYYVMVNGEDSRVFLGLRDGVDVEAFRRDADAAVHHGVPFDIERHVQSFPAEAHQLFLIPAGTPHGSGDGNVVLEISATPYLYSLRFYDWLRKDANGEQRPVHVGHAFDNLAVERTGQRVAVDLVQRPRLLREVDGATEDVIGSLPDMFFEVTRLELGVGAVIEDTAGDRFHILNVVEGAGVVVETAAGHRHSLAYAETLTIPAAAGGYTVRAAGSTPVRVVKAFVK
ncbi:class I mannose-6-phosphate isomerase [Umezawaea sp. NPDC059074]|uniref:class I mannose-6-phosphate isomerase n=1 Tax=Umezawaea sp. NPDC059074 TaxID=3346716 RepID=UPI0036A50739